MSFLTVATDAVANAAKTLEGIGSGLSSARTAAAAPTAGIAAAAQDEVSAAIAKLFSGFGQEFQAVSAQAQAFHDQFVNTLNASMEQYAIAEAYASQGLLHAVNPPTEALLGLPLIGTGAGGILPAQAVSFPAINYPTALGPILLTLYGDQSILGTVSVTAGSLQVPTPITLGLDAISPFVNVGLAFQNGNSAFMSAMQTGNTTAAVTALAQTPFNAVSSFFVGGQDIRGSVSIPPYTGYAGVAYKIPVGGLFSPVQPVTLTLFGSDGSVTQFPLSGTQFGGIFAGIGDAITSAVTGM
ncbi:MAG: PE family protein [Mycobacterium sp.]